MISSAAAGTKEGRELRDSPEVVGNWTWLEDDPAPPVEMDEEEEEYYLEILFGEDGIFG